MDKLLTPWAASGDREAIPDAAQPDESVSYAAGWTPPYGVNPSLAGAKNLTRSQMNGVLYDATNAIAELQADGAAFSTLDSLRANNFALQLCRVFGGASAGDGFSAQFWRDPADTTSADDGVTVIVDAAGQRWKRQTSLLKSVSVLDYIPVNLHAGIRDGSNTTDLTAYIQAAFDDRLGQRLVFPLGKYKTTAGLITGLCLPYFEDGAFLAPEGSGYVAITLSDVAGTGSMGGQCGPIRVNVQGNESSPPTIDGIRVINPQTVYFERLQARFLDGYGVKIEGAFDCRVGPIETLGCGTDTSAAVILSAFGGDACNESVFERIQPENAPGQALNIAGTTTFCTFLRIHVEGVDPVTNVEMVNLGGNRCTYLNTRITSLDGANGFTTLEGSSTYVDLTVETRYVEYNPQGIGLMLIKPNIADLRPDSAGEQAGKLTIIGGEIGTFTLQSGDFLAQHVTFTAAVIAALMTGSSPGGVAAKAQAAKRRFENCTIASFGNTNRTAAVWFDNCTIAARTEWVTTMVFTDCVVTPPLDQPTVGCVLECYRTQGTDVTTGSSRVILHDCRFTGALTATGTREHQYLNTAFDGGVSLGLGNPPDAGTWLPGQVFGNIEPASATTPGWVCTAGGTPGTFTARANLA